MKWKDLSLKERKQIYDSVRVNNPDATYLDIKQQFDSIPAYQDGKGKTINKADLPPEYRTGTPEYFERQRKISGAVNTVQPEAYITPAGYIKDAVNFIEDLGKGDYTGAAIDAAIDAALNLIPWGVGKGIKKLKSKVERIIEGTETEEDYDSEFSEVLRKDRNSKKYQQEISRTYDSVRVNNPDATYLDIKQQFDSIPAYQDGKGKTINKADLPPEYRTGTPEYFERQRKISGAVNTVQPEAYITPAGYIKDAVNFIEDLGKGDYTGAAIDAAIDAALNLIPWGVGKGIKKLKSKVERIIEGTETEEDYDSEFSEVLRKDRNSKKYQQEISRTIEQAIFPDERTRELVENVDKTYGTNYKRAYSNIAYKDTTKRGSYVKWGNTDKDGYGQINIKNIKDNVLPTDINDYNIILDNNIYMPGTANHELGHVADGLAGSRKIQDFDSGKEYITNTYLNYLANSNNTLGLFDAAGSRSYLLNPTEAKSHMLTLKRSLKDSGKITNWSTPVDENMILEYMRNPTSNKMVKNQYDLYRNKNEYIDRLNKLIPMEILMPLGGAGFVGHELNKE